ncbi:hypothetical protein SAMN00777080_4560 [Aquiflexum balticum DSM 16537]|uniref:Uncharacterized protein n=1 Tax=Aquiflexum balticum DSM 16537 TaxID=758820 RepID=A0A1W2HAI1_9BACT|nr:hypothetical protein SAMN00777080_4560 [Aquiflexum balticum DSM 16537]
MFSDYYKDFRKLVQNDAEPDVITLSVNANFLHYQ